MKKISQALSCNLSKFKSTDKILSVSVTAIEKIGLIVDYFNKYLL